MPKSSSARSAGLAPPPFDLGEPGAIEFTAERALAGQALNRFALSLRLPAGREAFAADEPGYLRGFGLTAAEIGFVADRDWTGLLLAGGHLQAMLKLAAAVGQDLWSIGGIGISHTPSMGLEHDRGMASPEGFSPRWRPWYDGTRTVEELIERLAPDHIIIVVYNDHLNYFDLDNCPTLAVGPGARFRQADEGWGLRALPDLDGDLSRGLHLTSALIEREFDLVVSQDLAIDHGVFSWLPYVMRQPWPVPVTPIAVNMIRQPLPTANRLRSLGAALRASVAAFPGDDRVLVIATGGMSHQISGARFGIANEELDRYFLRRLPRHLVELVAIGVREYMRFGGTEAAELTLWFAMRAALSDQAEAVCAFQAFPAVTGCGALVMTEPGALTALAPPALEASS